MRIIFFCGSLEPGKDGVGDYTMRLAEQLISLGCKVAVVSLNDKFITKSLSFTTYNNLIPVFRGRFFKEHKAEIGGINNFIDSFQPDYGSLQYVPYSFSKYGFNLKLGAKLSKFNISLWHVMYHEVFIKASRTDFKKRIIQSLQKQTIKTIYHNLSVKSSTTSNIYYKSQLNQLNINSKILKLFGNIPIVPVELDAIKDYIIPEDLKNYYNVAYFATLPSLHELSKQATEIISLNQTQPNLQVLIIGKSERQEDFKDMLKGVRVKNLGKLPERAISIIFQKSELGVSRVPLRLVDKSGSVVSMLEHGLPIWVPVREKDDRIWAQNERFTFNLKNIPSKEKPTSRIILIAKEFLNILN